MIVTHLTLVDDLMKINVVSLVTSNSNCPMDSDQSSMVLANQIRNCIGKHMSTFDADKFQEAFASAIIAMYTEVARLKHLIVSTGEVEPEDFDKVFQKGVSANYENHIDRPETIN